jgi:uncharacterized protein YbjT (DUF2867 family)
MTDLASPILVTGATGTTGRRLVAELLRRGASDVRAAVRTPDKAAGARPVVFDLDRPETYGPALAGVEHLFLLLPFRPDMAAVAARVLEAARGVGVRQVVRLSALGAGPTSPMAAGRWHAAADAAVARSGLQWTLVRPASFMQNFLAYHPPGPDGAIVLPAGDGAVSFIDNADVAAVAAQALLDGHHGAIHELTGPAALTFAEAAAILGRAAGRPVRYVDVPEEAARQGMTAAGLPAFMVEGMLELYAVYRKGYAAQVTGTVELVLGRPARDFAAWVQAEARG